MTVPHGSLWRVLPFVAPSVTQRLGGGVSVSIEPYITTVNAWDAPRSTNRNFVDGAWAKHVDFPVGTLLVVGGIVPDAAGNSYCSFVEVLLPQRAYINRTHFNRGSGYLERVA